MALSGLHVACGYAGASTSRKKDHSLLRKIQWSESPASATATTNVAPKSNFSDGDPVFQVVASADSYVSIGPAPNASQSPRFFVKAAEITTVYASPGDKLAWVAA